MGGGDPLPRHRVLDPHQRRVAGVREVVYTRSMPLATEHLQIVQSAAAENAAVIGASMLAIHHALSPEGIDALAAR